MRGLGQCGVGAEGTAQDTTRNGYKDLGICLDIPCMYVCNTVHKIPHNVAVEHVNTK